MKYSNVFMSRLRKNIALCMMVLIPLAFLLIFKYGPLPGIQISFRDYRISKGVWDSAWVGLKHFIRFFNSYTFGSVFRNTIFINLYSLLTFPIPLFFALLLNYVPWRGYKKTIQTVSYIPHFISMVVLCSMILQFTNARGGLINEFLGVFGVQPVNYMAKPEYFYGIYVWTGVWQNLGYNAIIYIAALSGVSNELHEAAIADGANIFKRILHIDIPSILPTFCILFILRCGQLLTVGFEKILLLQNNLNSSVSEVISTYTYNIGLNSTTPQYSYAAAIGLFTAVVNVIFLVSVNLITKKINGNSLW